MPKKITCFLLNFLLVSAALPGFAQLAIENEVNIPLSNDALQEMQVISLDNDGVLVVEIVSNSYGKKQVINFIKYDTNLKEQWQYAYEPGPSFKLMHIARSYGFVHFYFQEDNEKGFAIARLATTTGQFIINQGQLLTRMDVDYFEITGSKALLGGSYNDRAVVEMFNFVDNSSKVLPGLYSNHLKVAGISKKNDAEDFVVMIRNSRNCLFYLYNFTYDGKLVSSKLVGNKENVPLFGSILNLAGDRMMLVGNYADNCSNFSTGFYVYDMKEDKKTNFYDFASIDNYLNYLPEKRKERILSRIISRRKKGKDFKIRQRILLHHLSSTPQGWLMVAEIYYPEYNTSNNNPFLSYRSYRVGNEVFNQFNYSHAFIGEFDYDGNMVWSNSINLRNVSTRELNEITQITAIDKGFMIAYPDDGIIRTSIINEENEIKPMRNYDLKRLNEKEQITDVNSSNLMAWYGQSFLVYGNKRVSVATEERVKNIFFLRKLSYDPNEKPEEGPKTN